VLARPERLPVRADAVRQVLATMCLPTVASLDELFAELRRILRPTGTLAALVPSRPCGSVAEVRAWWPLHRALGRRAFRNESARDRLGWLYTAADFAVLVDQRRVFWLPIPDQQHAAGVMAALAPSGYLPFDVAQERLRRASSTLAQVAVPGYRLPIPLRLVVGRR
jgi:SAM-dependent methyltransferase